ncbi:hypothetical protein [Tychonema sp. LEGE 07203]|uniref:hypothetical protein n=2 Tax=Tychonema TaxID=54312 RepID=UPI001D13CCA4|nr:hypothetical protein [Tychonema sp. LEGE 07203]
MRAFQGLQTPTKKPGFYRISRLKSSIFGKNPVSGAPSPSKETGFFPEAVGFRELFRKKPGFWGPAIGFLVDGRSGYNTENLTTKMTVMRELIQQELEKFDREQLQQVFEFIAFLKFRARLVSIPAIDETNLAELYSEFAEEDRQLAELGISEYSELLKHEDLA